MASSASEMQVASVCLVAIPMALVFATVARKAARQNTPLGLAPAAIFVIGHIAIWGLSARGPRSSSGVMNLLQIAAITVFVLLEKVPPLRGERVPGDGASDGFRRSPRAGRSGLELRSREVSQCCN